MIKWFLSVIVVLNLLVAAYGSLKQRQPIDVHAQEVHPQQVKLLPKEWQATAASAAISAKPTPPPAAASEASAPQHAALPANTATSKIQPAPVIPARSITPPAESVAVACWQWGPLDDKLLKRVQGGLPQLKLKPEQIVQSHNENKTPSRFWVHYPPLATQAETQTLAAELKDKGFDNYIVKNEAFNGHLSLGLYAKEDTAKVLVARLKAAGYTQAAIHSKEGQSSATLLSFKALTPEQDSGLQTLQKRLTPGITLKRCT
ncbi:SPOR domain-containing protein [Neisseriaceae bacterium TC5R-5]|nr:SPOR domain-containing protein [Neisseriaceae bacterium TC5R-5]